MASGDCLDLKEVGGFVSICALTISHLGSFRVESVGAYKVRGSGHVTLNGPCKGLVVFGVRPGYDGELASLVLG